MTNILTLNNHVEVRAVRKERGRGLNTQNLELRHQWIWLSSNFKQKRSLITLCVSRKFEPKYNPPKLWRLDQASLKKKGSPATPKQNPSAQTESFSTVQSSNFPTPPCVCRASSIGFLKHCYSQDSAHYMNANINQKYWRVFPVVTAA